MKLPSTEAMVHVLIIFNTLDAFSTDMALRIGFAHEMNPVMAWAWRADPAVFWILKTVLLAAWVAWAGYAAKSEKSFRQSLTLVGLIFIVVLINNAWAWARYLGSLYQF